jgi:hypothetical protein
LKLINWWVRLLNDNIGDNKEYTGIIEAVYKKAGHCKAPNWSSFISTRIP